MRNLGYVGFGATDPVRCLEYCTKVLGLMPARAIPGEGWNAPGIASQGNERSRSGIASDGSAYLKVDDWQWRIAVHKTDRNRGLLYMGFELQGVMELEAAVAELNGLGYRTEAGSEEQAASRAVTAIANVTDPAGNRIELFYGPTIDRKFVSPTGTKFVSDELGLGHLNFLVADLGSARDFYTRGLGFRLTDYIRFGRGGSANFFHCNSRHHTIGLTHVGPASGLHHIMLEVENVDQVGMCLERAEAAGETISVTLGRHANDQMYSFYMRSPLGIDVEIGCEAVRVSESWTPYEFVEGDLWGHKGLTAEAIKAQAHA